MQWWGAVQCNACAMQCNACLQCNARRAAGAAMVSRLLAVLCVSDND